jgi:hypothetical protein
MSSQPSEVTTRTHIDTMCRQLAVLSMQNAFGRTPYDWQANVLCHLNKMTTKKSQVHPAPVFLCQPTGGGKSMVRDAFAAGQGGVTWSVSPLLSLGADQETKINQNALQGDGGIVAIHLDHYRSQEQQQALSDRISGLTMNSATTVIILSSPQAICNNPIYQLLFQLLIDKSLLVLFCIDEAHLFVQFGLWFRDEFLSLKQHVFQKLSRGGNKSIVPILFMTATATETIINQITLLTGLSFDTSLNVFWPTPLQMRRRVCTIKFYITNRIMETVKALVTPLYKALAQGDRQQWILYANSRVDLENYHKKVKAMLNEQGFLGDVIIITGPMFKEQKFYYTNLFLNTPPPGEQTVDTPLEDQTYDAIGCLATRSLGSAGWDGKSIHLVMSADFPTDICSISQEKGRTGRSPDALPVDNTYAVCGSLASYVYLLRRIHFPPSDDDKELETEDKVLSIQEYRKLQMDQLLEVLEVFVLPNECLHCILERRLANPYSRVSTMHVPLDPCVDACDFCIGTYKSLFPAIVKVNLRKALLDLFIGEYAMEAPTIDKVFVDGLKSYPSAQLLIFGSKAKGCPEPRNVKKVILMLIAARIVTHRIVYAETDEEKKNPIVWARLNMDSEGNLVVYNDLYWAHIPQKEPT